MIKWKKKIAVPVDKYELCCVIPFLFFTYYIVFVLLNVLGLSLLKFQKYSIKNYFSIGNI